MSDRTTTAGESYTFGPFRLDVLARELVRDGQPVSVPGKTFDTLLVLLRNRHRVVEKDELVKLVWPDAFVSDDSLTHSISVLRKTLGDHSSQPEYIATIPRRGYRMVAAVQAAGMPDESATGEPSIETQGADAHPQLHLIENSSARPAMLGRSKLSRLWIAVPVVAAVFLMVRTANVIPRGMPPTGTIRFVQEAPRDHMLASGAIVSPDGRYLAFVAREHDTGKAQLWLRPLDSADARPLPDTEGAFRPFWSPDSESLGFFADGKLKRVALTNQTPQTLADVGYRPSGGTWSTSGVILFSDRQSGLFSVPDTGGPAVAVTKLDGPPHEIAHQAPYFLPDGRHFLFFVVSATPEISGTYVGSLDSPERTRVLDASCSAAIYAEPGYLLYARDGSAIAQRFDVNRMRIAGPPHSLGTMRALPVTDVRVAVISSSATGILAFGGDTPTAHLTWFGRNGQILGVVQAPTSLHNPTISPDERYVAADSTGTGTTIWLLDLARGTPTRVAEGVLPVWGTSGRDLAFTVRQVSGTTDLVSRSIMGASTEETVLARSPEMKIGGNWTRDNKALVFTGSDPRTRLDLWVLAAGERTPVPFLRTPFNEMHGQVSPDGRWIAYASDESGAWSVYVQSFPVPGAKRMISLGGGAEPLWRGDGRELYYLTPDGTLMAVPVVSGATFDAGTPQPLFRAPITSDIITYRNHYAPAANGQKFLIDSADDHEPINVVINWSALISDR